MAVLVTTTAKTHEIEKRIARFSHPMPTWRNETGLDGETPQMGASPPQVGQYTVRRDNSHQHQECGVEAVQVIEGYPALADSRTGSGDRQGRNHVDGQTQIASEAEDAHSKVGDHWRTWRKHERG